MTTLIGYPWWKTPPLDLSDMEKNALRVMPKTWFLAQQLHYTIRSPEAICRRLAGRELLEKRSHSRQDGTLEYRVSPERWDELQKLCHNDRANEVRMHEGTGVSRAS